MGVRDFSQNTLRKIHFTEYMSPSETSHRKGLLTPKMALIPGKTTLLFSEYSILLSIWLSGAELELKMAANNTYWKAKLLLYGIE